MEPLLEGESIVEYLWKEVNPLLTEGLISVITL